MTVYLRVMYGLMFVSGVFLYHDRGVAGHRVAAVYAATLAVAIALRGREGFPSMWCLLSAVAAPLAVYVCPHVAEATP